MKKLMNWNPEQIYSALVKAFGFTIGWLYFQFAKIPAAHAWDEIFNLLRSFVYGGIGAVGAWVVKTYLLKAIDAKGGWKPWLRSLFKSK